MFAGKTTKPSKHHIPTFIFAGTSSLHCTAFFYENIFGIYFLKLYPCNYLSNKCSLYNACDLLLGDHVCEKSDAVKSFI